MGDTTGGSMGATIAQKIYDFITEYTPLGIGLVCLAFFVLGVMLVIPRKKVHELAIDMVPYILIGAAVLGSAMTLGKAICAQLAF